MKQQSLAAQAGFEKSRRELFLDEMEGGAMAGASGTPFSSGFTATEDQTPAQRFPDIFRSAHT